MTPTMLRFNDGITIDTSGPLRTMRLSDGWYVVGEGMLLPAEDHDDAEQMLSAMLEIESPKPC